jgi:hypothetical protein
VGTEDELQSLRADRLQPGSRVWVCHYFSHFGSTSDQRLAFQRALREDGFGTPGRVREIGADEEITGDGYWHHWAFTLIEASEEPLRAAEERARRVAEQHGVQFDGWEVQRETQSGMPGVEGPGSAQG